MHACPTGIDIRDGIQLECINCGLCIDACNEIMDRTGQQSWLITWDTLARVNARQEGRNVPLIRVIRPRTLIYLGVMTIAIVIVTTAFALRSQQMLFVGHDRAPLFVMLPDGTARNGYTVNISNKTLQEGRYVLRIQGVPGVGLRLADRQDPPADHLDVTVAPDMVGTFRVLVSGALPPGGDASPDLEISPADQSGHRRAQHLSLRVHGARGLLTRGATLMRLNAPWLSRISCLTSANLSARQPSPQPPR